MRLSLPILCDLIQLKASQLNATDLNVTQHDIAPT